MSRPNTYEKLTHDDFVRLLGEIVGDLSADQIIAIPGIYEILSEYFNNEVLEAWEAEQ